jgi:type IV pilus assembly protein PilQ
MTREYASHEKNGMRSIIQQLFFIVCLLAGTTGFATANSLEDISVSSMPGDRVQVTLSMSEPATNPLSFTIDNPARIAIDLVNTKNKLTNRNIPIGIGMAKSINSIEARGRTRVVINLSQLVSYQTQVSGNKIIISLDGSGKGSASSAPSSAQAPSTSPHQYVTDAKHAIKNVDFRRGEKGEGRIIVTLSDSSSSVDMRQEGGKILVDFSNSDISNELLRRLDVLDFATPVKTIDTMARGNGTRLVITPINDNYDHLAYQTENVYTIEVKPLTKEQVETAKKKRFGYTGERLSLTFQDIEVRAVLQLLADFTGLNMVVSDNVSGNISLRLKNVPWDQAMDIILKTKGLGMRKTGNVVLIAPSAEIAAREKLELESQKQIEELAPLRTEWFQINYAKGSDIAALLKSSENNLLSGRGSITIDERTNTLLIQDTADKLAQIRSVITKLDIPVRQVLIESRVVIANRDFTRNIGVRFGAAGQNTDGEYTTTIGGGGVSATPPNPGLGDLIVDLPAGGSAGTIGLAIAKASSAIIQLELSALQIEGEGEIISSPRVITANQKSATIKSGVEIPYQEASSSGATSVSFKTAALSLTVTPQITPDDQVILDLNVNKDSVGAVFNGVPSIDTRTISTQVLVSNGETVVLGGIYEENKIDTNTRVPFFADIPVLGKLFQKDEKSNDRSELLIFVTPKILKDDLKAAIQ